MTGKDTESIGARKPVAVGWSIRNYAMAKAVVFRSSPGSHIVVAVVRKETAHMEPDMEVEAMLAVGLGTHTWMGWAMGRLVSVRHNQAAATLTDRTADWVLGSVGLDIVGSADRPL